MTIDQQTGKLLAIVRAWNEELAHQLREAIVAERNSWYYERAHLERRLTELTGGEK